MLVVLAFMGIILKYPLGETDNVDKPISLYAATKKCNEFMAFTYNHLYNLTSTGLRFFTVYGPWGRPDMEIFKFTEAIIKGKSIEVFNDGKLYRDFTFIDDVINGVIKLIEKKMLNEKVDTPLILNIGNNKTVKLIDFICELEKCLKKKAIKIMSPMQKGDVNITHADIKAIADYVGFLPATPIEVGIQKFCDWYLNFYNAETKKNSNRII
jgi:UDP-glucuronate 4-epimerase